MERAPPRPRRGARLAAAHHPRRGPVGLIQQRGRAGGASALIEARWRLCGVGRRQPASVRRMRRRSAQRLVCEHPPAPVSRKTARARRLAGRKHVSRAGNWAAAHEARTGTRAAGQDPRPAPRQRAQSGARHAGAPWAQRPGKRSLWRRRKLCCSSTSSPRAAMATNPEVLVEVRKLPRTPESRWRAGLSNAGPQPALPRHVDRGRAAPPHDRPLVFHAVVGELGGLVDRAVTIRR